MTMGADDYIRALGLRPHPEGGHFRRLAAGESRAGRASWSGIYYLLRAGEVSRLHRIAPDEIWCHHAGAALLVHAIAPDGALTTRRLGVGLAAGEEPQTVVRGGCVFGAELAGPGFALVSCLCVPGFEYADFVLPSRRELLAAFPQHRELVERLTAPDPA